jgi:hypothetical protein
MALHLDAPAMQPYVQQRHGNPRNHHHRVVAAGHRMGATAVVAARHRMGATAAGATGARSRWRVPGWVCLVRFVLHPVERPQRAGDPEAVERDLSVRVGFVRLVLREAMTSARGRQAPASRD